MDWMAARLPPATLSGSAAPRCISGVGSSRFMLGCRLLTMNRRFQNLVRGTATLLEIAPDPKRAVTRPLYSPPASVEIAIRGYWQNVGNHLLVSLENARLEQKKKQKTSPKT